MSRMGKEKGWYRRRTYAHFDRPISEMRAHHLVSNPSQVAKHAFWPIILNPQKTISLKSDNGRRVWKRKVRPIAFAAHSDCHIYAYYAKLLNERLEDRYAQEDGSHVLAYRRFTPAKCNVHFALEAFEEIKKKRSCDVIAIDVEGFFDTLNHQHLKRAWAWILEKDELPPDHYAVFKACTRDSAITIPKLRDILGGEVRRRIGKSNRPICSPPEFRRLIKPFLRPRHVLAWEVKRKVPPAYLQGSPAGIPQGLPISAVLANLYMYSVDLAIKRQIEDLGGSYRRYSDDILLVVPSGKGRNAEDIVQDELKKAYLTMNSGKTIRRRFDEVKGSLRARIVDGSYHLRDLSPASYLGLNFDGQSIQVRDSTVAKFIIKARRAIERAKIAAEKNNGFIKKRQLYARLTRLGYGRAYGVAKYDDTDTRILPKGAPRLGFFRYLRLVERLTDDEAVRKQMRTIERKVFQEIKRAESDLNLRRSMQEHKNGGIKR